MVLQLHGNPISTCTQRILMTLAEKNIPYEMVVVDLMKAEQKNPEHTKHQPFGQVPFINDDGFILYESRAICRYLALKYIDQGTPLMPHPSNLKAYALFEQAASVEQANYDPYASKYVAEVLFKPWKGLQTDEKVAASLKAELAAKLDVYDTILSKQEYAAGNDFSLVDIFHIPYGALLQPSSAGELLQERPHVKRWWDKITARESWAVASGASK